MGRLAVIVVALALSIAALALSLIAIGVTHPTRTHPVVGLSIASRESDIVTSTLLHVLSDARRAYLENPEASFLGTNLARLLVLNSSIVSRREIVIDDAKYLYVVLALSRGNVRADFDRVSLNGVLVERIPRNESVTYTGCQPVAYRLYVGNASCVVRAWVCGLPISSYRLYANSWRVCRNIYFAWIWLGLREYAWLLLERAG